MKMKRLKPSINPNAFTPAAQSAIRELEEKGFLVNGEIRYEETQEAIVNSILERMIQK